MAALRQVSKLETLRDWALRYAHWGLSVFPLKPQDDKNIIHHNNGEKNVR